MFFNSSTLNLSMNAFVHPYLAFCRLHQSENRLFVNYFILIYILEALCTHAGDPKCTHDICIVIFTLFVIIILITYSIFS